MAQEQKELYVRVLVETDKSNMSRTLNFVMTSLKGSCRNLKNGAVALGIYDENDRLVGLDITGSPSPEMSKRIDELFEEEAVAE